MARRPVAVVAAIVLLGEALGIVLINWFMGRLVDQQNMSLGGISSDTMRNSTYIMGGVSGFYLAVCGVAMLLIAVRDRAPGRFGRILLISCAVVHGVLGALTVGLVGWTAFAFMMVVLALIVLVLMMYAPAAPPEPEDGEPAEVPTENGTPPSPATA
ncbi:hypothetical protein [Streptomyces sp. CBMA152]|uniref:hypothetical protein n=1 Tax=Streptomyces sp. CBMA152 TaxID=1896312 RepID=UPI0016604845|nr:hypothetical protein [Streptomyces sp. CBMA152]MBD0745398.1 hypothetical protein [Streptomyces sp. CBMA152]